MKIKPVSKKENIVVQEFEKELLVYDLKTNKAFCLNETSALVWQLCDGTKTVSEISDTMSRKLKTPVPENLIWLALNELRKDGLLENDAQLSRYFAGFSRREMVKKVGLASMIALPIVSSVVAPNAVQALSVTCGQPCQCFGLDFPATFCLGGFHNCHLGCLACLTPINSCVGQPGIGSIICSGTCASSAPVG